MIWVVFLGSREAEEFMYRALSAWAIAIALLVPSIGIAQGNPAGARPTPAQEKELQRLYQRLLEADAKRDTAAFKQILAPSYTFVPPRGDTILTREQRLAQAATDTSTNRPSYTLHSCRTQVHGTTAVAHCRYSARIKSPHTGADTTRQAISTVVFVQQGKTWQIVATHPSLVRPR
jgi:uncharacterized protein (TIGR02246 family)